MRVTGPRPTPLRRPRTRAAVLLAAALGAACASSPGSTPVGGAPTRTVIAMAGSGGAHDIETFSDRGPSTTPVAVAPAAALQALPAIYAELGLGGGPATGRPQTYAANLAVRRQLGKQPLARFLNCSVTATGEPRANVDLVKGVITTEVLPHPEGSAIVTQLVARTIAADGASGQNDCTTTGLLEARIAELVRERAK